MNENLKFLISDMAQNDVLFRKYIDENPSYILKNYLDENKMHEFDLSGIDSKLKMQAKLKKLINKEAERICTYNKKIIGIKGCFLENKYYKDRDIKRYYNDIDIIVPNEIVYDFYLFLLSNGYKIVNDNQFFYNNSFVFKILKNQYLKLVHCVDLVKQVESDDLKHAVYIDFHSDLNVGLETSFNMRELYNSAKKISGENYEIYELAPLDYVAYLIIHMIKHLPYINHYSLEISIDIQKIYDIFVLMEDNKMNVECLEEYFLKINSLHYYVLFLKIYNEIFVKSNIDYERLVKKCNKKWQQLLRCFIKMNITKIILGDYSKDIPAISRTYNLCLKIKNQTIGFLLWKIYMRFVVKDTP